METEVVPRLEEGHHESVKGRRTAALRVIRWVALGVVLGGFLVAAAIARDAAGGRSDLDAFTASTAWLVAAPIAVALVFAIACWNRLRGDPVLARWLGGFAVTIVAYGLWSELAAWLDASNATGTWAFAVIAALTMSGWMVVLATAQATAAATAGRALADRTGRGVMRFLIASTAGMTLLSFVVPAGFMLEISPQPPLVLPRDFVVAPAVQTGMSTLAFAWMLSLFVAPTVFWVQAARSQGARRAALARIAVGAVLPGLVVLLCGLLALLIGAGGVGGGNTPLEISALAIGFCVAAPLVAWWLSAVLRDARTSSGRSMTALSRLTPPLLWIGYVLAIVQLVGPVVAAARASATGAVVATAGLFAATAVPWALFVRWCVERVDPRRGLASAVIGASSDRGVPTGELAERALREALAEPALRVQIARPGGGWLSAGLDTSTTAGGHEETGAGTAASVVHPVRDHEGREVGRIVTVTRFVDLAPLLMVVAPLIERAALEAEVRDHAERLAAERRRADAAAHDARRRIERDLHDGVQSRLVSLGLSLSLAKDDVNDPASRMLLDETVAGLQNAVAELRELAGGTVSANLAERGLAAAVADLVSGVPVAIEASVDDVDLAGAVETAAYFVIAEAVANALKHAAPQRITIAVRQRGSTVTVSVADDGTGGADVRLGSGLRGLSERVGAVGGRMVVSEREPRGTLLEAVLPCAP
ncbi:sensor histidine kinase [Agromyces sp. Root81]|uniref:sensor histidine kinase n=1 Tax=Agromyces sp. Root81 TaxID=1736601 RepID=UPI000B1F3D9D|nr:histidine kinase [Agromyces sp. Root81]